MIIFTIIYSGYSFSPSALVTLTLNPTHGSSYAAYFEYTERPAIFPL